MRIRHFYISANSHETTSYTMPPTWNHRLACPCYYLKQCRYPIKLLPLQERSLINRLGRRPSKGLCSLLAVAFGNCILDVSQSKQMLHAIYTYITQLSVTVKEERTEGKIIGWRQRVEATITRDFGSRCS